MESPRTQQHHRDWDSHTRRHFSCPDALKSDPLVTRVNSTNVLDEGLRIGEIGRRMNSKVNLVKQTKRGRRTWLAFNLAYTVLSRPLYIGGQVLRIG
jgi:hypothetical protein